MTHTAWLLERAHALLEQLMGEGRGQRLVWLPPEGASLLAIERDAIVQALERCDGNQAAAGRLLDLSSRVMCYKVRQHGLTRWMEDLKRRRLSPASPNSWGPGPPSSL